MPETPGLGAAAFAAAPRPGVPNILPFATASGRTGSAATSGRTATASTTARITLETAGIMVQLLAAVTALALLFH